LDYKELYALLTHEDIPTGLFHNHICFNWYQRSIIDVTCDYWWTAKVLKERISGWNATSYLFSRNGYVTWFQKNLCAPMSQFYMMIGILVELQNIWAWYIQSFDPNSKYHHPVWIGINILAPAMYLSEKIEEQIYHKKARFKKNVSELNQIR
jgi:hypothetical protein